MALAEDKILHKQYPATSNKWYADVPLDIISKEFKPYRFELQDFTIPKIVVGSTTISYKGVDIEVPNHIFNGSDKTTRFTYLIDENWESYLALYQWANCFNSIDNPTPLDKVRENDNPYAWWVIPIHVHLLSPYRGDIMHIVYYGCTLKSMAELQVKYTEKSSPMSQSFTISYQRVEIAHTDPSKLTSKGGI